MNWKQKAWIARAGLIRGFSKLLTFDLNSLFLTGKEVPYASVTGGADVSKAYKQAQCAYSCIRRIATDVSGAPMVFLSDPDDIKSKAPADHKLPRLFANPGPGSTQSQAMNLFVTYVLLRGDAFLPTDSLAEPSQLYAHFDPQHWKAMTRNDEGREELVAWQYQNANDEMTRLAGDVIYHKLPSPYDSWRGQSPLEAASYAVSIAADGPKYHASVVDRGGERGITYKTPMVLTDDQYKQLRGRLKSRRKGGGQAPEDVILEGGMDIIPPSFTSADVDILALLGPAKEDICQAFGMSPTLIGQANESNYSTFRGYLKIYWLQNLVPFMRELQESFDRFTVPHFGLYTRFDLSKVEPLQDYLDDRRQTATAFYKMGVTPNELNRRLNLGFAPEGIIGGDEVLVNLSQAPMSAVVAGATVDALLSRNQQQQTANEPDKSLPDHSTIEARAASLALAVPHQRRLSKIAKTAKTALRQKLLAMKEGEQGGGALYDILAAAKKSAQAQGIALALMSADEGWTLDDALAAARHMPFHEREAGRLSPSVALQTLTEEIEPDSIGPERMHGFNAAINLVSPVVNELVQSAASRGFEGRVATITCHNEEEQTCSSS